MLVAAYFVAAFPLVSISELSGSSEARELHVAQVIHDTGNWLSPTRNGLVASKPPLYHWITAALAEVLGIEVIPALGRITSLLFAAGTLYITLLLAHTLFSKDAERSAVIKLTAFILVTTYGFSNMAVTAMVDMCFTFWVSLACYFILRRFASTMIEMNLREYDFSYFFFAAGVATLAKGPLGFVLPSAIIFFCIAMKEGVRTAARLCFAPRIGWLIYLLVAVPWYILLSFGGAQEFIDRQIFFENVRRAFGGEHIPSGPPWFYLPSLLSKAAPWSALFLLSLVVARSKSIAARIGNTWFIVVFVGFSIAAGKRHSYLLPLYPPMALALAAWIIERVPLLSATLYQRLHLLLRNVGYIVAGIACSVIVALLIVGFGVEFSRPEVQMAQAWLQVALPVPLLVLSTSAVLCVATWHTPSMQWFRASAVHYSVTALLLTCCSLGDGIKAQYKDFAGIAAAIFGVVGDTGELVVIRDRYEEFFDPILYYLRRPVRLVEPDRWNEVQSGYLLAKRSWALENPLALSEWHELVNFRSILDRDKSRNERDVVLYKYRRAKGEVDNSLRSVYLKEHSNLGTDSI